MFRFVSLFFVFLALVVAAPATGLAETKEDPYAHFERANRLASAGAITRSIPHYEKAIALAPDQIPLAFFNLASVLQHKGRTAEAVVLYHAFQAHSNDPEEQRDAQLAVAECQRSGAWGTLNITPEPSTATIKINGHVLRRGEPLSKLPLPKGTYRVSVEAVDHEPFEEEVKVSGGSSPNLSPALQKIIYFGTLIVRPSSTDVTVKIHESDDPSSAIVAEMSGDDIQSVKVTEGRHFVEITGPNTKRWIRNVSVGRNSESSVDATLQLAVPEEIRF